MEINTEGLIIIIVTIIGIYYIYNYYSNIGLMKVRSKIDEKDIQYRLKTILLKPPI